MSREVSIALKLFCISQLKTNVALILGDVPPVKGGRRRFRAKKHATTGGLTRTPISIAEKRTQERMGMLQ